jgi:hypothetical protein
MTTQPTPRAWYSRATYDYFVQIIFRSQNNALKITAGTAPALKHRQKQTKKGTKTKTQVHRRTQRRKTQNDRQTVAVRAGELVDNTVDFVVISIRRTMQTQKLNFFY